MSVPPHNTEEILPKLLEVIGKDFKSVNKKPEDNHTMEEFIDEINSKKVILKVHTKMYFGFTRRIISEIVQKAEYGNEHSDFHPSNRMIR